MRTPTWRASCQVLSGCPPRGIPKVVGFGLGCAEIRNSKVQTTQDLYDGLYCLDVDLVILVLRGSLPTLIYLGGQCYMNPSLILA
jgi:hypothetical protein